ncbi:MAG TPA: type VI secretion system-associated FHA domain protein TagH [Acetobacteraceae bacterium]|nr:type VI secretion system-associated FHA domain protein TagH [Acetobacteraceae bacterium]
MTRVLVLTLDGTGESRQLASGALSVGRGQDNDWALVDPGPTPTVSRRHCRFAFGPDGATVTDLGSTNGTRVDGRALAPRTPASLRGGETIEVGARRMFVELSEAKTQGNALSSPPAFAFTPTGMPNILPPGGPRTVPVRGTPNASTGRPDEVDLFAEVGLPGGSRSTVEDDPLAGAFSEALPPLQRGRRSPPVSERSRASGPPQTEALLPRRAPPLGADPLRSFDPLGGGDQRAAPPERAGSASRREDRDSDPFGFGLAEAPLPDPPTAPAKQPAGRGGQQPDPASGAALLAAFLEGAGQDAAAAAAGRNPEAFLRETGRVFARLANGVRELLAVRATVKDHAGLDRTQISAALNNPLKLSVNGREATAALLGGGEEGYLAPLAAVEASFRDLKAHELAILEGAQSAVEELLELFDPAELERKLDDAGMLAVFVQGGRRARLWEVYQERYGEIAGAARTRFMGRLDDAFRSAYARKSAEVSALTDPTPPPPGTPRA